MTVVSYASVAVTSRVNAVLASSLEGIPNIRFLERSKSSQVFDNKGSVVKLTLCNPSSILKNLVKSSLKYLFTKALRYTLSILQEIGVVIIISLVIDSEKQSNILCLALTTIE